MPEVHTRYTTAPVDYDGFGTQTERVVGRDKRGQDIREVVIQGDHLQWQSMRYGSGLHPCWTREDVESIQDLKGYVVTL